MKKALVCLLLLITSHLHSQEVGGYLKETNSDSLVKTIRELTGEDSVYIDGVKTIIAKRTTATEGNTLARQYIKKKLCDFNLHVAELNFNTTGWNILATQIGKTHPDSIYIICAHHDAITFYCADDNASGVAAVLEAARILSKKSFNNSIIYAFWDEEELGRLGSINYVQQCNNSQIHLGGILNLDMIGYDSNNDKKFDIHTNNAANSLQIADSILSICQRYKVGLTPTISNPGNPNSDHSPFWVYNYGAIAISESLSTYDINPFYHSREDRIEHLNIDYLSKITALSTGVIATLAVPYSPTVEINNQLNFQTQWVTIQACPGNNGFLVKKQALGQISIQITDLLGRIILTNISKQPATTINTDKLPKGYYCIIVTDDSHRTSSIFIKR